jgi:hypothetical protein
VTVLVSTIAIAVGGALVWHRDAFARFAMRSQNRTWGFKFGEREERVSRAIAALAGIGAVLWGVAGLAGMGGN